MDKKSLFSFLLLLLLFGFLSPVSAEGEFLPVFRHYNIVSGEHLYTADWLEDYELNNKYNILGWRPEGKAWYFYRGIGTPVYRLYNPNLGEHLYTTDINEINSIVYQYSGWLIDFNGQPVFRSAGPIPIYRLYEPSTGRHLWTTDQNEYNTLPGFGWNQEGIALYGYGSNG